MIAKKYKMDELLQVKEPSAIAAEVVKRIGASEDGTRSKFEDACDSTMNLKHDASKQPFCRPWSPGQLALMIQLKSTSSYDATLHQSPTLLCFRRLELAPLRSIIHRAVAFTAFCLTNQPPAFFTFAPWSHFYIATHILSITCLSVFSACSSLASKFLNIHRLGKATFVPSSRLCL